MQTTKTAHCEHSDCSHHQTGTSDNNNKEQQKHGHTCLLHGGGVGDRGVVHAEPPHGRVKLVVALLLLVGDGGGTTVLLGIEDSRSKDAYLHRACTHSHARPSPSYTPQVHHSH